MTRRRKYKPIPPITDIFNARPCEIAALRKALHFNRADLAYVLCVTHNPEKSHSSTVTRWERGQARPQPHSMGKLTQIADMYRDEYLKALAEDEPAPQAPQAR